MVIITCATCGKESWRVQKRPGKGGRNYCDASCQLKYEYQTGKRDKKETSKAAQKAWRKKANDKFETNPAICRGKRGYLIIHIPGKGQKYLHHYMWEDVYGKERPKGMHIHHIDGNVDNNELSNLQMLTNSEHMKLHWKTDWKHKRKSH